MRYPDEKLFALDSDPHVATVQTQTVIGLASIAKLQYDQHGSGVLVLYFRDREECEDLAVNISLVLQGTRSSRPSLPRMTYEPWPLGWAGPRVSSMVPIFNSVDGCCHDKSWYW
jgi:hypothetical protein